jgi:mono/diheme cytochrome c family protein
LRHLYVYRVAYTIGALLVLASLFFAWIRSEEIIVVPEEEVVDAEFEDIADIAEFDWQPLGQEVYDADCAACHGGDGQGRDEYPSLAHTPALFAAEGGRVYLIDVMLYGLESDRHDASMPAFDTLSDAQVAAALNHTLTSWGNEDELPEDAELYIPPEIAEERGKDLSPQEVNETRP